MHSKTHSPPDGFLGEASNLGAGPLEIQSTGFGLESDFARCFGVKVNDESLLSTYKHKSIDNYW